MENNEIAEAKKKLYNLLLQVPNEKRTDIEIDVMYALAFDDSIQDFLMENL